MSDDKTKTVRDRKFINLTEDYELRYWTGVLGVSASTLREAVQKVGNSPVAVREYLKKSKK